MHLRFVFLYTVASDILYVYALNLAALQRDVLSSALLQSQGRLCRLINRGSADQIYLLSTNKKRGRTVVKSGRGKA